MFVEIVRLFIVLLATAAGFEMGKGSGVEPGTGAILGATLGALLGYVAGGAVGRLLRRAMGTVEAEVERVPAATLLVGSFGGALSGLVCTWRGLPAIMLLEGPWGWPILGLVVWIGVVYGWRVAGRKAEELLALVGLSTRPLARASRYGREGEDAFLVDSSAVLDGRLLPIANAGFLPGALLVPRFVLDELQGIADAQDLSRRRRGVRGLEELDALRRSGGELHVLDDEVPEHVEVDAKLIALARRHKFGIITTDGNLQRVAELQGIRCLNLNMLAAAGRPAHIPGELLVLPLTKEGTEPGQGVGYLDDGTMVVVTDAAGLVGSDVEVRITSSAQTSIGRMLFASVNR